MAQSPRGNRPPGKTALAEGRQASATLVQRVLDAQSRERARILQEVLQARGLMPLLMKQRNGARWTAEERRELRTRLHALSQISPYLLALAVPGSALLLPLLSWWLDRRRRVRA